MWTTEYVPKAQARSVTSGFITGHDVLLMFLTRQFGRRQSERQLFPFLVVRSTLILGCIGADPGQVSRLKERGVIYRRYPVTLTLKRRLQTFWTTQKTSSKYLKNEFFGFSLTYYENNRPRQYFPDFI